jgi:hypothetical protein
MLIGHREQSLGRLLAVLNQVVTEFGGQRREVRPVRLKIVYDIHRNIASPLRNRKQSRCGGTVGGRRPVGLAIYLVIYALLRIREPEHPAEPRRSRLVSFT